MTHLFRKYQQPIMIATTLVIAIAFVWLYNGTSMDQGRAQPTFRVYGRTVSQLQIEKAARRFQVAAELNMNEFLLGLAGNAHSREEALEEFVWNGFVLDHEARKLGIAPTDQEVLDGIKTLPAFQTGGQFDPAKYQAALQNFFMPNGFTETQLEEMVRDQLRLRKLVELVGSGVDFTPEEYRGVYAQNFQKMKVSYIAFRRADFAAAITPTEEEIQKYYEDHKPELTSNEERAVSFVKIELGEEEKKLTGKERVAALQKQNDAATQFGQALVNGKGFAEAAKEQGLEVKTTAKFSEADAPAELAPQAAAAAFRLTPEAPDSDPVSTEAGYVILHLEKVDPSRPLSLEEARARVVEALKNEQGEKALTAKAGEVRGKVEEALKSGKPFAEAAQEAGQKAESVPAFSLAQPPTADPFGPELAQHAVELAEGGLSPFAPTSDGGLLVYLEKREPVDETQMAKDQETQLPRLREMKRLAAFHDWLSLRRREAKVQSLAPRGAKSAG